MRITRDVPGLISFTGYGEYEGIPLKMAQGENESPF